jgi:hypothetical protein
MSQAPFAACFGIREPNAIPNSARVGPDSSHHIGWQLLQYLLLSLLALSLISSLLLLRLLLSLLLPSSLLSLLLLLLGFAAIVALKRCGLALAAVAVQRAVAKR